MRLAQLWDGAMLTRRSSSALVSCAAATKARTPTRCVLRFPLISGKLTFASISATAGASVAEVNKNKISKSRNEALDRTRTRIPHFV